MGAPAIFAAQTLRLTYSTSSRHGGQAKAGFDAPLAAVFYKWSVASQPATRLRGSTARQAAVELMHRNRLMIDARKGFRTSVQGEQGRI